MTLCNLDDNQVEFIIGCIEKASVKTAEQQELLGWITLQFIHQQDSGKYKELLKDIGYTL